MNFVDWLKGTFGKQTCAFCGNEVGMLKRTKIKSKEFICNDCGYGCSRYIQKYRYTKDELLGHMEYMKRQDALYQQIQDEATQVVPSATNRQSIEFYDGHGMFRIRDLSEDRKPWKKELFRYDQVAKYEPYLEEGEPEEEGKPKVFGECGVDITLVGANEDGRVTDVKLTPHVPSEQHYLHLRWATLQQLGKAVVLQNKQGPRYVKTCVWMLLPFKIYKTLGKSLSFSEPQVVHL